MIRLGQLPTTLDLDLYRGDGFGLKLTFIDKDTGLPYPMDGSFKAEVRHNGAVVTEFAIDNSDAASGNITIGLAASQTPTIPTGSVWDLQQSPVDGVVRTWYRGTIRMYGDVTDSDVTP